MHKENSSERQRFANVETAIPGTSRKRSALFKSSMVCSTGDLLMFLLLPLVSTTNKSAQLQLHGGTAFMLCIGHCTLLFVGPLTGHYSGTNVKPCGEKRIFPSWHTYRVMLALNVANVDIFSHGERYLYPADGKADLATTEQLEIYTS
jgi:hypothetical protein